MIPHIENDKELFEFIRSNGKEDNVSLKELFSKYNFESISINELVKEFRNPDKTLIIDARSENEYNESHLPDAINFPVLNNLERHNVGLLYKKYSQSSAIWLAKEYANPKSESLKNFLNDNKAKEKEIIVYCWRGGGRSKYLSKMITDLGYKIKFIESGQKAYRKKVNDFFKTHNPELNFLELRGLTGSGKTELLNLLKNDLPVIDLELAARHYSSLFGNVPYDINNYPRVKNQSAFENSLFEQFARYDLENPPLFIIESESKRVGDFSIPDSIYNKIESAPCVQINCSLESRTQRITKDYFGDDLRGLKAMEKIYTERERFFKEQLSNEVYARLLSYLKSAEVSNFTKEMMEKYYDKRYKVKPKLPIEEISSEDINEAKIKITKIYKKIST